MQHTLNSKKGWYETSAQNAGYMAGHSVVLEEEIHNILNHKNTEGLWNGKKFEIAGAETGTPKNIRSALSHCASKRKTETAVIFLPNSYSKENIRKGIRLYEGLRGSPQYKKMEHVYFMSGESIRYDYSPE